MARGPFVKFPMSSSANKHAVFNWPSVDVAGVNVHRVWKIKGGDAVGYQHMIDGWLDVELWNQSGGQCVGGNQQSSRVNLCRFTGQGANL